MLERRWSSYLSSSRDAKRAWSPVSTPLAMPCSAPNRLPLGPTSNRIKAQSFRGLCFVITRPLVEDYRLNEGWEDLGDAIDSRCAIESTHCRCDPGP